MIDLCVCVPVNVALSIDDRLVCVYADERCVEH